MNSNNLTRPLSRRVSAMPTLLLVGVTATLAQTPQTEYTVNVAKFTAIECVAPVEIHFTQGAKANRVYMLEADNERYYPEAKVTIIIKMK